MRPPRTRPVGAVLVVALLLVSCAGDATSSSTVGPTDDAAGTPTTQSPTTQAPTSRPSTSKPPTSQAPTSEPPATTPAPGTTVAGDTGPPGGSPLPAQIVAALDTDLALLDLPSGGPIVLVPFFNGDGVFRAGLQLAPGGETVYFSEGYEDYWYSCEASQGATGKVDLATGSITELGAGYSPMPSPNGALVARLYAGTCFPDAENPEAWVLTAVDTVIVTDENGDDPVEHGIGATPTSPDDPAALLWVGWETDTDLLVLTVGGALHRVPLGSAQPISDHPTVASGLTGLPVGFAEDGLVVVRHTDDFSSATVVGIDLASGNETELAATSGSVSVGIDPLGRTVIAEIIDPETAPMTKLTLADGTEIFFDIAVHDVDW